MSGIASALVVSRTYTDPSGPDASTCYRQRQEHDAGEPLPLVIEGRKIGQIGVREMLP